MWAQPWPRGAGCEGGSCVRRNREAQLLKETCSSWAVRLGCLLLNTQKTENGTMINYLHIPCLLWSFQNLERKKKDGKTQLLGLIKTSVNALDAFAQQAGLSVLRSLPARVSDVCFQGRVSATVRISPEAGCFWWRCDAALSDKARIFAKRRFVVCFCWFAGQWIIRMSRDPGLMLISC